MLYLWFLNDSATYVGIINQDPAQAAQLIKWNRVNTTAVIVFALIFSIWCPFFQKSRWGPYLRKYWGACLITLVFIFSSYHFSKSFYRKWDAFAVTPTIAFLKQKLKEGEWFRIYSSNMYFPSTAAGYGIPDIRYMVPITPQNTVTVLRAVFGKYGDGQIEWDRFESIHELDGMQTYHHPGFDLLNVRYFIFVPREDVFPSRTLFREGYREQEPDILHALPFLNPADQSLPSGPNLRELYRGEDATVFENVDAKERFFLVSEWEVFPELKTLIRTIRANPQILFKKALFLNPPVWPQLDVMPASTNHPPRLLARTNHSYRLEIQLNQPQILVISDTYYMRIRS